MLNERIVWTAAIPPCAGFALPAAFLLLLGPVPAMASPPVLGEGGALHAAAPASAAPDSGLVRVELTGFTDQAAARHEAGLLAEAGIETWVRTVVEGEEFAISAGVFGQPENVERMEKRLRELGYTRVQRVHLRPAAAIQPPLAAAVTEPAPVQEGPAQDVAPAGGATSGGEGPAVLELGSAPPPVSVPVPGTDGNVRIAVDQLRVEAGFLPQRSAKADGSHYLHGSVSAEWPLAAAWSARLAARFDGYVQTGDADFEAADLDYGESYLRYRDSSRRVTLGAQTVLWGQVDEIPPTDQLSVQDATRYVLDDLEDRRRAVLAARWEEFVGEYKIDMLYVPIFRAAELPDEESIWSPVDRARGRIAGLPPSALLTPLVQDGRFGEDDDGRGGWGVRVSRASRGFDYALTLQDARRSLPYYELNPQVRTALVLDPSDIEGALASASDTFIARHPRTWVLGGDVGFATEQAAWRFEAAWLSDQPATTGDFRFMELEAVEWVAGADFFPGDGDLRVTLQLGGRHLLDAPGELLDRKDAFSIYGDVESRLARDRWIARLRFFQGLDERDTYLNPGLSFTGWEPHEFTLGYHYFDGSDSTLGGFYQDNDLVTLAWRARY